MQAPIGIFGGTFDPVHLGHLRAAEEVQSLLSLQQVIFVPCGTPALGKQAHATAEQRLQMVLLATKGLAGFAVDRYEVDQPGPSYAYDTLRYLRTLHAETPLCFIVGVDAFLHLEKWHRWQQLFGLAHFVVIQRPGYSLPAQGKLPAWVRQRWTDSPEPLHQSTHGRIFVCQITPHDISATAIRSRIAAVQKLEHLLPDRVQQYIVDNSLYMN